MPFISDTSGAIFWASTILAPVSSTSYIHNYDEMKRRKEAKDEANVKNNNRKRKYSPMKRLEIASRTLFLDISNQKTPSAPLKKCGTSTRPVKNILSITLSHLPPPNQG